MSENLAPADGGQGAPAGAAPVAAAPAPAPAPAAPTIEWLPTADEATVGLIQNKGWKSPADVLTSYTALEKFVGVPADKMLRLPTETSTKEDLDSFYSKLGRPADAKEYGIKAPEGQDGAFAEAAAGKFHELGLTTKQAQELTNWYNGQAGAATEAQQASKLADNAAQQESLKKEWGAGYDTQITQARMAAQQFGVDAATLDKLEGAMGYAGVMKFMAGLGAKVGESGFPGAARTTSFTGAMTPAQAKSELADLRNDKEFTAKYLAGNTEAKAKMLQLQAWANPE